MPSAQRFMNVSDLTFTPAGGAPVAVDGVSRVTVRRKARTEAFSGDGDVYPSAKHVTVQDPTVTVEAMESAAMDAVEPGAAGVLRFTDNAAGGYAGESPGRRVTVSPALYLGADGNRPYRKQTTVTMTFETYSPDGRTDPVTAEGL